MASFSAFFAGITAILAKCGIKNTDTDVVTFLRTAVVLFFSYLMVFIVGSYNDIEYISIKSFIFLILSGIATGCSWLCYFKALSLGDINRVVPIDKSSTILSVLLAIIIFKEYNNLYIKLACTVFLTIGTFMMIEKKDDGIKKINKKYLIYAILSAVFASLTSILAKIGVDNVESNLATAIRTTVVLFMSLSIVFIKGKQNQFKYIKKDEIIFIILSGIATGCSWLCYYYAIQNGIVSIVVPIDKLSILVSILFSTIVFKEKLSFQASIGLFIIVVSTLMMTIFS